jgi:hypothetical protein
MRLDKDATRDEKSMSGFMHFRRRDCCFSTSHIKWVDMSNAMEHITRRYSVTDKYISPPHVEEEEE